jgi:glycosyltransferase involved in cell wall biosynthesis
MSERNPVRISVIIPVGRRHEDIRELYAEYRAGLDAVRMTYEFVFVMDGPHRDVMGEVESLIDSGPGNIVMVVLNRSFGESTAIMAGFERSCGEIILTLPAYHQVDAQDIGKLVAPLDSRDLVQGWRWPRAGNTLERIRRSMFHGLVARVTGMRLHDLGCGARAMKRVVLQELSLYGDQHRLLAVLANRQGFSVTEVEIRQSDRDRFQGVYMPREYAHFVLDVFTVFFLVRFTKKPLRFFGMLGAGMFGLGALLVLYLVVERLAFNESLADRPALLLSALVVVLGLQLFALGLLAELIIFTHARHIKDYQGAEVIQYPRAELPRGAVRERAESAGPSGAGGDFLQADKTRAEKTAVR